ncbi:iron chelate uptake ABC transporter family permease subunit [Ilumatobacter coccineus]|uniref:Iron siderophore ABC transporter permease protein n=1 Tax=Ilumatobacter coccineus (strain NBRC 103263 / KCTC 29153 / YM16-304) TaxID=1313172 RepID=A0A6C7E7Z8_ILUCY|nr:iron chelate uptake ABC transporter family permease subunit [Ilumatobacter coccineus]BAN03784.1 iron siderophore ABC transporter permease protein [Ilumatobacter coccineus YM16-304]
MMSTDVLSPVAGSSADSDTDASNARNSIPVRLAVMAIAAVVLVVVYQFALVEGAWDYVMDLRARQLVALVAVGAGTGVATLMFQTVTHNRILTPGIMGFDALFQLVQTMFVWTFGSAIVVNLDVQSRFVINAAVMTAFGMLLYRAILRRTTRDLFVLVLVGIVLGTLFSSLALFASRLLSPNDYLTLQDLVFTSFNTIDPQLLTITTAVTIVALALSVPLMRKLDVVALGRDSAVTLGLDYRRVVDRTLLIVTVLVATSTALVGPMTLIGLIVANLARQLLPTYRHRTLAIGSALIGIIVTVGGQFVAARLLDFTTTLTVCINLVGGVYFIWLLMREADL